MKVLRDGSPFAIRANNGGIAEKSSLHALPNGGFVALWESYLDEAIFFRHFNAQGQPSGEAKILLPSVNGMLPRSRSAVLADGQLLTVWEREDGLWARCLDPKTGLIHASVRLIEHFTGDVEEIDALSDGGFALKILTNPQLSGWMYWNWQPEYKVQLFEASLQPRAEPVAIQASLPGWSLTVQLVSDSRGGFLAVWQEQTLFSSFSDISSRLAWQRFDSKGVPAGPAIPLAETNWTNVSFPHGLVSLANGQVAVLWSQVNDVSRCRVQLFRADGRKLGHETILKGVNLSQFNYPYLSALPDGGFVAAWQVALPDGQSRAIGGQRFNHLGRPIGERFLVNDPTVHLFPEINITPLMDGRFVVGWIEANRLTDSVEQPDLERIWEIRGQILDGRATPIRVQGSQGDDDVLGTRFADHLFGAAGNDQLAGGAGSDRLDGGLGDDRLIGGPGTDRLRGGAGQDLFVFQAGDLGPRVWDTIVDFTPGSDRIDLGALDADLSQPGQQSFTLLPFPIDGGPKRRGFTAPGQLLYDPSTGVLSGNVNDSPHPDVQILLSQRPLLQPGDLLL